MQFFQTVISVTNWNGYEFKLLMRRCFFPAEGRFLHECPVRTNDDGCTDKPASATSSSISTDVAMGLKFLGIFIITYSFVAAAQKWSQFSRVHRSSDATIC